MNTHILVRTVMLKVPMGGGTPIFSLAPTER